MERTRGPNRESKQIWDDRDGRWKVAYEQMFKRLETVKFVDAVTFNESGETYTSKEFECAAFKEFLLMINLDVTGAPTDIKIQVQFSHDNVNWYNHMDGPFGSLMYEDSAGDKMECVSGKIIAHWMRVYVVSSGCGAAATFKLSVDAEVSA